MSQLADLLTECGRYGPSDGRRIAGQKRAAIQRTEESA